MFNILQVQVSIIIKGITVSNILPKLGAFIERGEDVRSKGSLGLRLGAHSATDY